MDIKLTEKAKEAIKEEGISSYKIDIIGDG